MATVQEFHILGTLWERLPPRLPVHVPKAHPLGRHRPRVPDRQVVDGIFFVLRTGCRWKALSAPGRCPSGTAHRRFRAWGPAGACARRWDVALQDDEELMGLDCAWMALDGSPHKAPHKAPLGGKKTGAPPTDRGKGGAKRRLLTEARGIPVGLVRDGANRRGTKLTDPTLTDLPPAAEAARDAHRAGGHDQHLCLDAGYD